MVAVVAPGDSKLLQYPTSDHCHNFHTMYSTRVEDLWCYSVYDLGFMFATVCTYYMSISLR